MRPEALSLGSSTGQGRGGPTPTPRVDDRPKSTSQLRGEWPDGLVSALTPLLELLVDESVTEIEATSRVSLIADSASGSLSAAT